MVGVFADRAEALELLCYLAEEEPAHADEFLVRSFDAQGRFMGETLTASR